MPVARGNGHAFRQINRAAVLGRCAASQDRRGDYDTLVLLYHRPDKELSPVDVANELLVSTSAVTGRLDKLERMGLLERSPDQRDRRDIRLAITEKGRDVVRGVFQNSWAAQTEILAALSPSQRRALASPLSALLQSLTNRLKTGLVKGALARQVKTYHLGPPSPGHRRRTTHPRMAQITNTGQNAHFAECPGSALRGALRPAAAWSLPRRFCCRIQSACGCPIRLGVVSDMYSWRAVAGWWVESCGCPIRRLRPAECVYA